MIDNQPFRRHIDDFIGSAGGKVQHFTVLVLRQRAVDIGRPDSGLGQSVHLILHEGNQRGDDQRDPGLHQRRHLIADRLPGAGRHDAQHIPALKDVVYDLLLSGPKFFMAKIRF